MRVCLFVCVYVDEGGRREGFCNNGSKSYISSLVVLKGVSDKCLLPH